MLRLDPSALLFFAEWRCALARHAPLLLRALVERSRWHYRENCMALLLLAVRADWHLYAPEPMLTGGPHG